MVTGCPRGSLTVHREGVPGGDSQLSRQRRAPIAHRPSVVCPREWGEVGKREEGVKGNPTREWGQRGQHDEEYKINRS